MHKMLSLLFGFAICLGLSGCSHNQIALNDADAGRSIALSVGDEIAITLRLTGGYFRVPEVSSQSIRFVSTEFMAAPRETAGSLKEAR
jgi:hypothetical protein